MEVIHHKTRLRFFLTGSALLYSVVEWAPYNVEQYQKALLERAQLRWDPKKFAATLDYTINCILEAIEGLYDGIAEDGTTTPVSKELSNKFQSELKARLQGTPHRQTLHQLLAGQSGHLYKVRSFLKQTYQLEERHTYKSLLVDKCIGALTDIAKTTQDVVTQLQPDKNKSGDFQERSQMEKFLAGLHLMLTMTWRTFGPEDWTSHSATTALIMAFPIICLPHESPVAYRLYHDALNLFWSSTQHLNISTDLKRQAAENLAAIGFFGLANADENDQWTIASNIYLEDTALRALKEKMQQELGKDQAESNLSQLCSQQTQEYLRSCFDPELPQQQQEEFD